VTATALTVKKCGSCQAPIVWARTDHDRRIPLDAEPAPAGNFIVSSDRGGGDPLAIYVGKVATPADTLRYVSHFVTCPNAKQHRRR